MGFATTWDCIATAESEIGFALPDTLRRRLVSENGGEVEVAGYPGDPLWELVPAFDDTDPERARRTVAHNIVRGTLALRDEGYISSDEAWVADNGTGDLLLARADGALLWRDHETDERYPVKLLDDLSA